MGEGKIRIDKCRDRDAPRDAIQTRSGPRFQVKLEFNLLISVYFRWFFGAELHAMLTFSDREKGAGNHKKDREISPKSADRWRPTRSC